MRTTERFTQEGARLQEEFVLILDADMVMRAPFIPQELGAKKGLAISAFYGCTIFWVTICDVTNILTSIRSKLPLTFKSA